MRKLRSHPRIFLILKLLTVALLGKILLSSFYSVHDNGEKPFPSFRNSQIVETKRDLFHLDVSNMLRHKSWSNSPVSDYTVTQSYQEENLVGFVSNLDLKKILSKKVKEKEENIHANEAKLKGHVDYKSLTSCQDLAYHGSIQHSTQSIPLEDDLIEIRRTLIASENFLSRQVTVDEEKEMTEREIIQKSWFQFGGSSVWLESEQCFVVYSRVIYSSMGVKNRPHVSLVRAQAYDKNWKEIKRKRIPYLDIQMPKDMIAALHQIDKELGLSDCDLLASEPLSYDACIVENTRNRMTAQKRRESILSKYYITYPTILEIPFRPDGDWKGPEDPHVILRKTKTGEEPVVVFNMYDIDLGKRLMMAHLPHRKIESLIKFSIPGREQKELEKNWTPFFHQNVGESSVSRGFVHFIYSFSPLEILKCSLNDGYCEMVFEAETMKITEANRFGGIRGGTQFIPLPEILPGIKGQQVWVGFPKQHIEDCGCGSQYYRPMFSVLVEHDGVYNQDVLVPAIGFNMDVLSWDLKGTYCKDINIMSPNSIAYWEIVSQDPQNKTFEDYLTLTFSEADSNTRLLTVKGMLDFILGIYKEKDILEKFEINEEADNIIGQTLHCVVQSAFDYCKTYGETHSPPPNE